MHFHDCIFYAQKWIPCSKFVQTWVFQAALTPWLFTTTINKVHHSVLCLASGYRNLWASVELWPHLGFGSASFGRWGGVLLAAWEKNVGRCRAQKPLNPYHVIFAWQQSGSCWPKQRRGEGWSERQKIEVINTGQWWQPNEGATSREARQNWYCLVCRQTERGMAALAKNYYFVASKCNWHMKTSPNRATGYNSTWCDAKLRSNCSISLKKHGVLLVFIYITLWQTLLSNLGSK